MPLPVAAWLLGSALIGLGSDQYVIVGAGQDSFSLKKPGQREQNKHIRRSSVIKIRSSLIRGDWLPRPPLSLPQGSCIRSLSFTIQPPHAFRRAPQRQRRFSVRLFLFSNLKDSYCECNPGEHKYVTQPSYAELEDGKKCQGKYHTLHPPQYLHSKVLRGYIKMTQRAALVVHHRIPAFNGKFFHNRLSDLLFCVYHVALGILDSTNCGWGCCLFSARPICEISAGRIVNRLLFV